MDNKREFNLLICFYLCWPEGLRTTLFLQEIYNYLILRFSQKIISLVSLSKPQTNPAKFSAKINMVLANGSSPHIHKVSHFTLANISTQGHSTVYEGYLAVSMKLGPVFAIPVIINNYQNETISISLQSLDDITLDQTKVISHFENKPISGIFAK